MKAYILTGAPRHGGETEWVIGIFSSLERAQEAADAEEPNSWDEYAITAHEFDTPWSDEAWQAYEPKNGA